LQKRPIKERIFCTWDLCEYYSVLYAYWMQTNASPLHVRCVLHICTHTHSYTNTHAHQYRYAYTYVYTYWYTHTHLSVVDNAKAERRDVVTAILHALCVVCIHTHKTHQNSHSCTHSYIHIYIHIHTYIQLIVVHNAKVECRDTVIATLRKLRVVYLNTHTYTHIHTHPHARTHMYIFIHTYSWLSCTTPKRSAVTQSSPHYASCVWCIWIHTHTHTSTHIHTNRHTSTRKYTYSYIQRLSSTTPKRSAVTQPPPQYASCMWCIWIHTHPHTSTQIHTHPRTHTQIYIFIDTQIVIDDAKAERCDNRCITQAACSVYEYTHWHTHKHTLSHTHKYIFILTHSW